MQQVVCADVTKIDYPENSFDLVFSNWLLMYLSDEEVAQFAGGCPHHSTRMLGLHAAPLLAAQVVTPGHVACARQRTL
jgi:hypothetical protein